MLLDIKMGDHIKKRSVSRKGNYCPESIKHHNCSLYFMTVAIRHAKEITVK
jgi:hypothetical protein